MLLLCFCLCALPFQALAASTTDAKEPISTDRECTLSIGYSYDGNAFPNQEVSLYKVAEVSADFQYTLTSSFAASGLILNGIQTNNEWNVIRSTLEAYILANDAAPIKTAVTDASGLACFTGLTPGLYLASGVEIPQTFRFDSALIALPGLGADGLWQYAVTAAAKPAVAPPIQPDEEIQLKVLKLWKGDEGGSDRPRSIEVEIFRNGLSYGAVLLSEENNWSYSWTAKADGTSWTVIERNVPAGYAMTVAQRENTFVLTNTRLSPPEPTPPQTGDTSNVLLYTIIMYVSGVMLVILGIAGKRKHYEETN